MTRMISWFAQNSVAANLLMVFVVCSGLIGALGVRAETLPEFSLGVIESRCPIWALPPRRSNKGLRPDRGGHPGGRRGQTDHVDRLRR